MSSIIDSIIFKVEFATNGALGLVTDEMVSKSTDITVWFDPKITEKWHIVDIKDRVRITDRDHTKATGLLDQLRDYSDHWSNGMTTFLVESDRDEYITKKANGSLFGFSFLPWEIPIYHDETNDTFWKKEIRFNKTKLNKALFRDPLAPDVLLARLQTIVILGTVGLVSFKGLEMLIKRIKKKIS